jgi:arylsulfatase A-like enzyme
LGHTFTLFDEEIKVPAFIDAPEALLTTEERHNLEAKRSALVFHVDIAPTILDLMGLWHAPELQRFRTRMPGHSLLGASVTERVLPMTNCAAVWSCAFENWGVMRGPIKLFARTPYDTGWQCHDVLADPAEQIRLDDPRCDALKGHAVAWFGNLPE